MYYKKIKGNSEFGRITEKLDRAPAEMSRFDQMFLSGVIEEYKPKKIIEIGVFSGRTTVDMLDFCYNIGLKDTEIYSVDIAEENSRGRVGYLIEKAKPLLKTMINLFYIQGLSHQKFLIMVL